jgi:hypothetical protein
MFPQRDQIKALIWVVDANGHRRFVEGRDALKDTLMEKCTARGSSISTCQEAGPARRCERYRTSGGT